MFDAGKQVIFPVFDNKFKIGKSGRSSTTEEMVPIAEMTSFSVSIDGSVQEWTPMDAEGWMKRMTTGKALDGSPSPASCALVIPATIMSQASRGNPARTVIRNSSGNFLPARSLSSTQ